LTPRNPAIKAVETAPIVLVACAKVGVSGFKDEKPVTDKGDFSMFDVALALQNISLAAHSLGLGTVFVGAFDAKKAAEILGVPAGTSVILLMPLGYPLEVPEAPHRKAVEEFVYFELYGNKRIQF